MRKNLAHFRQQKGFLGSERAMGKSQENHPPFYEININNLKITCGDLIAAPI
jgi:hypothetical protein